MLRAYANLAWAAVRNRAYPLAERYLEAAIAYASEPEFDLWWIYLLGHRARVELDRGRWDQAAETATLVIRGRARVVAAGDPRADGARPAARPPR